MQTLRVLGLLCVAAAPSCFVYDESLLDYETGLSTGGQGSGGEDGGMGGASGGTGNDGGAGAAGGGGATGGAGGGTGGTTGSGGTGGTTEECQEIGTTGSFTNVGSVSLIDDFQISWRQLNGAGFDGEWFAVGDDAGTSMSPTVGAWSYATDPCESGNHVLHVVASGYETWGVSYDARLWVQDEEPAAGLSAYAGIVFWARTDTPGMTIKIGVSDMSTTREVNVPPLTRDWKQYKLPFTGFSTIDVSEARVVHVVGVAAEEIDFWMDDLSVYTD